VKFLVDMPLAPSLAKWLRDQGHDAVHATTLGLDRAPDSEVLARAKRDGRTVVTADLDYPRLLALAGDTDPSLLLFRAGDWSDAAVVTRMTDVLAALSEGDIAHSIIVIERERVRRRKLPLKS
jgi:predicted nuclease of predicted toxin-antitoxin system